MAKGEKEGGEDVRCDGCKWWAEGDGREFMTGDSWTDWRKGWGRCMLTEVNCERMKHPQSNAVAGDHDAYSAVLYTQPNFGCVQFEAKE